MIQADHLWQLMGKGVVQTNEFDDSEAVLVDIGTWRAMVEIVMFLRKQSLKEPWRP